MKYSIEQNDKILKIKELAKEYNSPKRFTHIENVYKLAIDLAEKYKAAIEDTSVAAYGHDLMRGINNEEYLRYCELYGYTPTNIEIKRPILLHGKVSAMFLKNEFKVSQSSYNAIYWHVSGHINQDLVGKIIVISDFCEIGRKHKEASIFRKEAFEDLEKIYLKVIKSKIEWALKKDRPLIPEAVEVWNSI